MELKDKLTEKAVWTLTKFASDEEVAKDNPFEEVKIFGNILVNTGINNMLLLLIGGAGTSYSAPYLGVGDDATAENASQTDLIGAGKVRVAMNGGYPTSGTQTVVFQSDFTGLVANIHWQEFGAFTAAAAGIMLDRKVSDQGTKTSGQTWRLTLTITIS